MKAKILHTTYTRPKPPIKYPCLFKNLKGDILYATSAHDGVILTGFSAGTLIVHVDIGFPDTPCFEHVTEPVTIRFE